jgi:quinoprotein glucose dehydrogenase
MNQGEILWKIPHGSTPDRIRNNPALAGLDIPRTGQPGSVGTLVTKTLLIAGEPSVTSTRGIRGAMMRAYDKLTGADVGEVYLPAPQSGSPMTYILGGEQYIVIAVSGSGFAGELLAFKLPTD